MLKLFPVCAYMPYRGGEDEHRFYVRAVSSAEATRIAKERADDLSYGRVFLETWEGQEIADEPSAA